jgi:hypothetical protein
MSTSFSFILHFLHLLVLWKLMYFLLTQECQVFACSRLKIINYFPHCLAAVCNKLHWDHEVELELRLVSVPTTPQMYFSPGIE